MENSGQTLYLAGARGRAYLSAAKKSLWPCMCGYLLPLGTPRRLRLLHLPPPPPKSAEIPTSRDVDPRATVLWPIAKPRARFSRHEFGRDERAPPHFSLFLLSSLARYQPGRRCTRATLSPGSRVSRDKRRRIKVSRIGASAASMINRKMIDLGEVR